MFSMRLVVGGLCAAWLGASVASPWEFSAPIAVTDAGGQGIFHHLESAGRRNVAVARGRVSVVWEDDRDGTPRVYFARKPLAGDRFIDEVRVSGEGEAFEPSIAALEDGRVVVAWEQDGKVQVRLVARDVLGPTLVLGTGEAAQASAAVVNGEVVVALSERSGRFGRILLYRLQLAAGNRLQVVADCPADPTPVSDEQLYPAIQAHDGGLLVAWEDRRPGHTVIMATDGTLQPQCRFTPVKRINHRDSPRGSGQRMPYGRGSGVARVALGAYGVDGVLAAWADKRDFREGYDIYASLWQAGSGFSANQRVQDDFGGQARQWHATVAGDTVGRLVVGWDDERDGDSNVMLSWFENGLWSDDSVLPGAAGPGEQSHPSFALDGSGNLHAVWVERDQVGGPTRLRYAMGRLRP